MDPNIPIKTIDCLVMASRPFPRTGPRKLWDETYDNLCDKYGENVVCSKMERLTDRGYVECGVSPRTGWLTLKGRNLLNAAMERYA